MIRSHMNTPEHRLLPYNIFKNTEEFQHIDGKHKYQQFHSIETYDSVLHQLQKRCKP